MPGPRKLETALSIVAAVCVAALVTGCDGTPSQDRPDRLARRFIPFNSDWIPESEVPKEPQKSPNMVIWEFTDQSEDAEERSLGVFAEWTPPAGAEFQGFYAFADSSGGVAIIDVDSAATLARTTAPFVPWMTFTATPIIPIEEGAGIGAEAAAFRDSVD